MRRAIPDRTAAPVLDLHGPVELAVPSVTKTAARCRLLLSGQTVTLRARRHWDLIPGEIALVAPRKQWTCAGHLYLSGAIESSRLGVAALGLVPLQLGRIFLFLMSGVCLVST